MVGHLHDRDAALVGGRAETGEVAHHPAAERHEVVGAGHAGARELAPHVLGRRERLRRLARGNRDRVRRLAGGHRRQPRQLTRPLQVQYFDVGVGHAEGARDGVVEGPHGRQVHVAQQAVTHEHGVLAGGRLGPQQADIGHLFV